MEESKTILEAKNISRRSSGGEQLLNNISLDISAGNRLGITGPTGSGKTLLLRALALLDPIKSGSVLWRGKNINNDSVPAYRQQAIYLHQQPMLLEGTVESNLQKPFQFRSHCGRSFDRPKILAWLKLLDRDENFLSRNSDDLSGGEAQIVALLRAIHLEPALLFLDEPTAALDATSVAAIEKLVSHWMDEQHHERSTVWVSHDAAQIIRVSDRQLALKNGEIQE